MHETGNNPKWHVLLQGFEKTVSSYTATVSAKGMEENLAKAGKMTGAPLFDPQPLS